MNHYPGLSGNASELEERLSITNKLKEGMQWELEQTEKTLTYQLRTREQTIQKLQQQLLETSQVHVCLYILVYCIHNNHNKIPNIRKTRSPH